MSTRPIQTAHGPLENELQLPGCQLLSLQALLIAALADGNTRLRNLCLSPQTHLLAENLRSLGTAVRLNDGDGPAEIKGTGGLWPNERAELNADQSRTVLHLLIAACCLGHGYYTIDSDMQLHQQKVDTLVSALKDVGASIDYPRVKGYPPVEVFTPMLNGGTTRLQAADSPDPLLSLLTVAPLGQNDLYLESASLPANTSYVHHLIELMERFGVSLIRDLNRFIVPAPQRYRAGEYRIAPDAALAAGLLAIPAICGGSLSLYNLDGGTAQALAHTTDPLEKMGCHIRLCADRVSVSAPPEGEELKGTEADLRLTPQAVYTLPCAALFAATSSRLHNFSSVPAERISTLKKILTDLGATYDTIGDTMGIYPPEKIKPAMLDAADDPELTMSFATAGLLVDGIQVKNSEAIEDRCPQFFEILDRLVAS
jgi:3-phosphoshikimate 1-carboxyvinyltransferase